QAEDGIRDRNVTGVQTCALPIYRFGYSFMGSIEAATGTSSTVSMVLYAGIFGPVFEEIIYRGFLMKSLQRYGKTFAILVSAVVRSEERRVGEECRSAH